MSGRHWSLTQACLWAHGVLLFPAAYSRFLLLCCVISFPPLQLFGEDVRYFLPAYQRNYCWKQDTAIGFLSQVLDRVRDGHDELHAALEVAPAGDEARLPADAIQRWTREQIPESIGFIVLYRGREDGQFGVIDGQQRMVTLGFIFAALRECFLQSGNAVDAACAEEMHDRIWQRPHLSRGLAAAARLTVRRVDQDLYHELCLVPGGMRALLDRDADHENVASSESHTKMLGAQRIILDTLMDQSPCIWRMLASYICLSASTTCCSSKTRLWPSRCLGASTSRAQSRWERLTAFGAPSSWRTKLT